MNIVLKNDRDNWVTEYNYDACQAHKAQKQDWYDEHEQDVAFSSCKEYTENIERCVYYNARKVGYGAGKLSDSIGEWYYTFGTQSNFLKDIVA